MYTYVIQWNCRGLLTHLEDAHALMNEHRPVADPFEIMLHQYHLFRIDSATASWVSSGEAIASRKSH